MTPGKFGMPYLAGAHLDAASTSFDAHLGQGWLMFDASHINSQSRQNMVVINDSFFLPGLNNPVVILFFI